MPANLAEEIRRRKVARAITEEDPNDDPDPDDAQGSPTDSAEDSASDDDMGEKPAPAGQDEFAPAETVRAGAQKRFNPNAQSLSDYFGPKPRVPEQKPLEPIAPGPVNPSEPGPIAPGPIKPSEPVPLAGGAAKPGLDDEYVTDTATGKKIPRGQLVDPDPDVNYLKGPDLAAQIASEQPEEPAGAVQFGKIDVTGKAPEPEVRRAARVGVTPKAELVDPDPDSLYIDAEGNPVAPPGTEVRKAYVATPRAEAVTPEVRKAYVATPRAEAVSSEKPKYSVYNIDSSSYTLTMPDGSTRDVPADQFDPSTNEIKPPGTQADIKGRTAQPAQAPRARPVKQLDTGLYQDEKPEDFVSGQATMFADQGDLDRYRAAIASGASEQEALSVGDNGIGNKYVGGLETGNLAGVAVPEWVLREKYGNNYAKWRSARVDVVDPQTGKRLRLPIIDTGPGSEAENRGVVADFTPYVDSYFGNKGGGKNLLFKLVDNAGPDVHKNPQLFWDEQAALKEGFDSSSLARGVQKIRGKLNYSLVPSNPAENAALWQADAFNQQNFRATIAQLPEADSGNIIGLYKRLDKPVETVSDSMRKEIQSGLKAQIVAQMREKFPELKTDDEAWAKAQSDVGVLDVGREWVGKALGFAQQFGVVMKQGAAGMDQNYVDQFLNHVMPGASDQQKHEYLTKLYGMPPDQRNIEIASKLPSPLEGVATGTPRSTLLPYAEQVSTALTHLADPDFQKHKADELAQFKAQMEHNISDDPRLKGTFMEKVVDATAQMPSVIAAYSNPALWPIALAQAADSVREGFRHDHPEWDSKTLEQNTARATMVQFFGQIAANKILTSGGGALLGAIEGRGARAIAQAIYGTTGQAAIAGGTQAATNIIAGEPVLKGTGEAALTGAIQGAIPGMVHGAREYGSRPQGVRAAPKDETVNPPLVTADKPDLTERPQSVVDVLGSEPPKTITSDQADTVEKVVAHNVFPDLTDYEAKQVADRIAFLTTRNLETERFRYELERFLPQGQPYPFGATTRLLQAYERFKAGPTVYSALELQRAQQVYNEVRNPNVVPPGALKLPIMWQEIERVPVQPEVRPAEKAATAPARKSIQLDSGKIVTPEAVGVEEQQQQGIVEEGTTVLAGGDVQRTTENKADRRYTYHDGKGNVYRGLTWAEANDLHRKLKAPAEEQPAVPVTQEDVARRTYELNGERTKNGQPGTALDDWTQAQKDLNQAATPTPPTQGESEPWVSAIANRHTAERAARGEVGEVIPGEGYSKEELLARGLQMRPEEINQHASDLMNNRGGDPKLQAAAVRAEEARLSQRSNAASRASEANPADQQLRTEADNAFKDLTDWHNGPVAKLKNNWHAQGMTLQGEVPVDLTTFNGLREKFLRDVGKPPSPKMEPVLRKVAKRVNDSVTADKQALHNLGVEIERQTTRRRLPTADEVRTRIMEQMKVDPCPR